MSQSSPPTFTPNVINLFSPRDSIIRGVSVYAGRAQVTRLFAIKTTAGHHQVIITGLPDVIDHESIRVEGLGLATIHDVTLSTTPAPPPVPLNASVIEALEEDAERLAHKLRRAEKINEFFERYLDTLDVQKLHSDNHDSGSGGARLAAIAQDYELSAVDWHEETLRLQKEIRVVQDQIRRERSKRNGIPAKSEYPWLQKQASIGLFLEKKGEVKLSLVYAVSMVNWKATYDIRVDTTGNAPFRLIYKAAISQSTGEDWENVPLTLETVTPTFGLGIPELETWTITERKPYTGYMPPPPTIYAPGQQPIIIHSISSSRSRSRDRRRRSPSPRRHRRRTTHVGHARSLSPSRSPRRRMRRHSASTPSREAEIRNAFLEPSNSNSGVTATFTVPTPISIPSDSVAHTVTIAELELRATMSWVCVPKRDPRAHLKAKIHNTSEYALLAGTGCIYVDGSFISKSDVPQVSPGESFDCPLGLDPSVRVTYNPLVKKHSRGAFYNRTSNHSFSQQITIHNTKSFAIENFKVVDHIPVSEDAKIYVKLISPALSLPSPSTNNNNSNASPVSESGKHEKHESGFGIALRRTTSIATGNTTTTTATAATSVAGSVKVKKGITAQWHGADEDDVDPSSLGKNGKLDWICSIASQEKIHLVLQWEVTASGRTEIQGL